MWWDARRILCHCVLGAEETSTTVFTHFALAKPNGVYRVPGPKLPRRGGPRTK